MNRGVLRTMSKVSAMMQSLVGYMFAEHANILFENVIGAFRLQRVC